MSGYSFDRRKFFETLASTGKTACQKIRYPRKSLTMKMSDIGEIGKLDSIILRSQVMQAQNAIMADEIVNQVIRLETLHGASINLLLKAQKTATLAKREAPKSLRDDWILASLCLDIGKIKAPGNPSAFTASALRPYIDDSIYQVLKVFALFEDQPEQFSDRPWYPQALQFLEWNRRAVSENFAPGSLESFAKIVKNLLRVGPISGQPPDSTVIPELEE